MYKMKRMNASSRIKEATERSVENVRWTPEVYKDMIPQLRYKITSEKDVNFASPFPIHGRIKARE